ncbi:MAG: 3-methyl-2-oxobutanoate dehydrogenase subunit beta, partial [Eubacteriales bacterium]|nr:3-methyl-2-oxobutanoate dehydrogenase subunit beta [Eubacteriales bacterium]
TCSRICKNVIRQAAEIGIKVGLVRPITLWPFPDQAIAAAAGQPSVKALLDIELNAGQMVEDVRLAVNGTRPVHFHGRTGGNLPTQQEILDKIQVLARS